MRYGLVALAITLCTSAAAEPHFNIERIGWACRERWGDQPTMQDFCYNKHRDAFETILEAWKSSEASGDRNTLRAIERCQASNGINWAAAADCAAPHIANHSKQAVTDPTNCIQLHGNAERLACYDAALGYVSR